MLVPSCRCSCSCCSDVCGETKRRPERLVVLAPMFVVVAARKVEVDSIPVLVVAVGARVATFRVEWEATRCDIVAVSLSAVALTEDEALFVRAFESACPISLGGVCCKRRAEV